MRRKLNKFILVALTIIVVVNVLSAQTISPFNKLEVKDTSANYSFIISGHFHGASTNASTFPASSLLANIDTLNALHSSFLISLGDMFVGVNDKYIEHYQRSLFDKLQMPLFNSVGNHDVANGNMYEKVFGKEYFSFTKSSELYIVLNSEVADGNIKDDQLEFLKNAINNASSEKIKNIFIFSHRPLWAENNERYKHLFKDNTHTMVGSNNFETTVRPLLEKVSKAKQIIWVSGSLGGGPASFFYDKEQSSNIIFMQTAIRDQERDAVLLLAVNNGAVTFKGISFTRQQLNSIESYGVDFWKGNASPEEKFNFRMLPYLTMQMLRHRFFWFGFFASTLLIIAFAFVKKRRNSK